MQKDLSDDPDLQDEFASLKAIPNAWDLLETILSKEDPSEVFSHWRTPIGQSSYDSKFLLVMQVTLIDFCSKYVAERDRLRAVDQEITYWVETVIPMFKYFAGITGMIHFKWYEF